MRAGGSTKTSSDLASLSSGVVCAEGLRGSVEKVRVGRKKQ